MRETDAMGMALGAAGQIARMAVVVEMQDGTTTVVEFVHEPDRLPLTCTIDREAYAIDRGREWPTTYAEGPVRAHLVGRTAQLLWGPAAAGWLAELTERLDGG